MRWFLSSTMMLVLLLSAVSACSRGVPAAGAGAMGEASPDDTPDAAAEAEAPAVDDDAAPTFAQARAATLHGLAAARGAADDRWADRYDASRPLSAAAVAELASLGHDPAPPAITRHTHYWVSNELAHEVWRPYIDGAGDALIGVGTDQNYVLAGWAESTLLVIFDFDMSIVDLHRAYHAAFSLAETPADFVPLWDEPGDRLIAEIERLYDGVERERTLEALDAARATVSRRLRSVARRHDERGISSFLNDEAQYAHVRSLWTNQRVWLIRGDLTGPSAMVDLASVLDRIDVPVGAFYTSNAESYFDFGAEYRRNVASLPFAPQGCVLRTAHAEYLGQPDGEPDYHFSVQGGGNFRQWLLTDDVEDLWALFRRRSETTTPGLSDVQAWPEGDDDVPVAEVQRDRVDIAPEVIARLTPAAEPGSASGCGPREP